MMYVVIFTAKIKEFDPEYDDTAARLRELAITQYGCTSFTSCCEGSTEIALSYWPTLEHIKAWRDDDQHKQAQTKGKKQWYDSFQVKVAKLIE